MLYQLQVARFDSATVTRIAFATDVAHRRWVAEHLFIKPTRKLPQMKKNKFRHCNPELNTIIFIMPTTDCTVWQSYKIVTNHNVDMDLINLSMTCM